jgi:hypothetical protein
MIYFKAIYFHLFLKTIRDAVLFFQHFTIYLFFNQIFMY